MRIALLLSHQPHHHYVAVGAAVLVVPAVLLQELPARRDVRRQVVGRYVQVAGGRNPADTAADDDAGFYAAAAGTGSGWTGAAVYRSQDQLNWSRISAITSASVVGTWHIGANVLAWNSAWKPVIGGDSLTNSTLAGWIDEFRATICAFPK